MKTSASALQGPQVNVQPGSCLDLLRLLLTAAARASRSRAGCPRGRAGLGRRGYPRTAAPRCPKAHVLGCWLPVWQGTKSRGRRGALGSPLPGDREGEGSSVLQQERQGLRRWGCLPTEPFLTVVFLWSASLFHLGAVQIYFFTLKADSGPRFEKQSALKIKSV